MKTNQLKINQNQASSFSFFSIGLSLMVWIICIYIQFVVWVLEYILYTNNWRYNRRYLKIIFNLGNLSMNSIHYLSKGWHSWILCFIPYKSTTKMNTDENMKFKNKLIKALKKITLKLPSEIRINRNPIDGERATHYTRNSLQFLNLAPYLLWNSFNEVVWLQNLIISPIKLIPLPFIFLTFKGL